MGRSRGIPQPCTFPPPPAAHLNTSSIRFFNPEKEDNFLSGCLEEKTLMYLILFSNIYDLSHFVYKCSRCFSREKLNKLFYAKINAAPKVKSSVCQMMNITHKQHTHFHSIMSHFRCTSEVYCSKGVSSGWKIEEALWCMAITCLKPISFSECEGLMCICGDGCPYCRN